MKGDIRQSLISIPIPKSQSDGFTEVLRSCRGCGATRASVGILSPIVTDGARPCIGEAVPSMFSIGGGGSEGTTGMLMSSELPGIIRSGRPGMTMRVTSFR